MHDEFRSPHERVFGPTVVVLTCAASAGAHAGLVPSHLQDEPRLGVAFLVTVFVLLSAAVAVGVRPADWRVAGAAAVVLFGVTLAYLATRTTGIPMLDPEREAVDAVGVATTAVEVTGLVFALRLTQPLGRAGRPLHVQEVSR
jgi:hypothetical protein